MLYQSVQENIRDIMRTRVVSEVTREKLRICNTGKKLTKKQLQGHQGKNKGRKDTKETCELKRQIALKRPPMSEDVKEKIRQKRKLQFNHNKGRITITNGTQNKLILPTDEIPDGWYLGTWKKGHQTGKIFITDGTINKLILHNIMIIDGWRRGKTHRTKAG